MAKAEKAPEQPAQELATVSELALKSGQTFYRVGKDGKTLVQTMPAGDSPFKRTHAIAAVLHGWTKHERDTSEPVRLSEDDYFAALEAAKKGKTHKPADKRAEKEQA